MKKTLFLLLGLLLLVPALSACQSAPTTDPRGLTALVSVEGSDTMDRLMTEWSKGFMATNADIPVSVTSGNSGGGIAALINKTTDLAAASRDLTEEEEKAAQVNGVNLKRITVARDSIAIIVNADNPVSELTLFDLKSILAGRLKTWSHFVKLANFEKLANRDKPIQIFSREPQSGTQQYVQEHVLGQSKFATGAQIVPSADAAVEAVANDKWSISYVGMERAMSAGDKVKIVPLKLTEKSPAVRPTATSTVSDYPLSRPLMLIVDANHKPSVEKFVQYCLSDKGQLAVGKAGYVRAVGK